MPADGPRAGVWMLLSILVTCAAGKSKGDHCGLSVNPGLQTRRSASVWLTGRSYVLLQQEEGSLVNLYQ